MASRAKKVLEWPRVPVPFTREVLEAIPIWVELGARPADIAEALGTTVGSLQVKCSQARISLAASPLQDRRVASMDQKHWAALRREAMRRGLTVPRLIAEIVMRVAERDAFREVLGAYDVPIDDRRGAGCAGQ